MPFAGGNQEIIDRAMFAARIGEIAADADAVIAAEIEAETWLPECFGRLAEEIAKDPEKAHYLTGTTPVNIIAGVSAPLIPPTAAFLSEYIEIGGVRDANGNVLVRVHNYDDFLKYLPPVYGYYCLSSNRIFTREIGTGDFAGTDGPLQVTAPIVPTAGSIPDNLTDDLITMLAARIRYGVLAPTRVPM
jgi:hypothetical protein